MCLIILSEDNSLKLSNGYEIFVDEPELKNTVLDFPNYIKTLSEIILNSDPKFTVGIFGDWGTGKTTLMENILQVLEGKNVNCVRFNAWRYEGESRLATFPMMLSILGNLLEHPAVKQKFESEDKWNRQSFIRRTKRVLKGLSGSITAEIPLVAKGTVNIEPQKMMEQEDQEFDSISRFYSDNKPILQEGYEIIKDLLIKINGSNLNPNLKLVVFIDDLDRCTPEKAAQVFESIKVFFDMFGIVFVLGLSRKIVEAAIDVKYEKFVTKQTFKGSDYIKKIIQVPFALPPWTKSDIKKYLETLLENHADIQHVGFLKKPDTMELISEIVESNPRDVKRLLNNFILARQIFENESRITDNKLLLTQVLVLRWKWFYDNIFKIPDFLENVKTQLNVPLESVTLKLNNDYNEQISSDKNLTSFLNGYGAPLLEMDLNEWNLYQRTSAVDLEYATQHKSGDELYDDDKDDVPRDLILELKNMMNYLSETNEKFYTLRDTERSMNPLRRYSFTTKNKLRQLRNEAYELENKINELRGKLYDYKKGPKIWNTLESQIRDPYYRIKF